jgi:hypothetical protein
MSFTGLLPLRVRMKSSARLPRTASMSNSRTLAVGCFDQQDNRADRRRRRRKGYPRDNTASTFGGNSSKSSSARATCRQLHHSRALGGRPAPWLGPLDHQYN